MDGRRSLLLAAGLAGLTLGCTHTPLPPGEPIPAGATIHKAATDTVAPKPKPSTYVAYGDFQAREATQPNRQPADQQACREKARKAYQFALNMEPNHLPALLGLARLYIEMEDHDRAIGTYRQAVKVAPKGAEVWHELGMAHCRKKEWEPGMEALRTAHQLDPENRQHLSSYGFCLARAGRYEESAAVFRPAYGEAKARYNVARMLQHLKEPELARKQAELAVRADPRLEPASKLLAELNGAPTAASGEIQQVGVTVGPPMAR